MFKGISCGKIRLVTRVGVAVCSVRGLHIHFFSLSQMQMYVKKYEYTTFLHKVLLFVVKNGKRGRQAAAWQGKQLPGWGNEHAPPTLYTIAYRDDDIEV